MFFVVILLFSQITFFIYFVLLHFSVLHLSVGPDRASAFHARVGADLVKALGAHVLLVLLHVLLAVQVVTAVEAVKSFGHGGGEIAPGGS